MKGLLVLTALLVATIGAAPGQETNGTEHSTRHPEDNLIANATSTTTAIPIPDPVDVTHGVSVSQGGEVPRVEIDHDGIPLVHGVIMPDDPEDKTVWRNARVLNNVLVGQQQQQQSAGSDLFVYRPQSPRIGDDHQDSSFQPSQSDPTASSLPYPAFYYQQYYQDKDSKEQLPDTVAVETSEDEPASTADEASADGQTTDGRGFKSNNKYKKTGLNKLTPGSSIGNGYARPIAYYVQPDEAKAIHDDRSPYDYEPAQQTGGYYAGDYTTGGASKQDYQYYGQQQQQQQQAPQRQGIFQQSGFNVVPAPSDSFVIRDQTYNSGGQAFTVPIPIPKDQYVQQYAGQPVQYGQYTQYPQYQYQYQQQRPQSSQQPLDFLGAKLKEQVQKAKDMIHDMTDPVVDPLMEAGQKISTNLGLPERVHKLNEKVATPSVLVPLAMAGGAALALGGLGTALAIHNSNTTSGAFKNLGLKNSQLMDRLNTLKIKVKRSADEDQAIRSSDEYDEDKENLLDRVMSSLNGPQRIFLAQLQRTGFDQWQRTSCAKRIFCDVMIQQSDDAVVLMEKRMSTFLTL